ncbi:MAG: c-type cytochrome [Pirellulales bacterium]
MLRRALISIVVLSLANSLPLSLPAQQVDDETEAADQESADQELVERVTTALTGAIADPETAQRVLASLPAAPPNAVIAALREHDRAGQYVAGEAGERVRRELYQALGRSGDFRSLHYLKETFEAQPERREDVAAALVQYAARHGRRAEDWQALVRALPILSPPTANRVLAALATYPQRGTKPRWLREVILVGWRLPPDDRLAAVRLLEHWTGRRLPAADPLPTAQLTDWQRWFAEKYPDEPPAELPVDRPQARYRYQELLAVLRRADRQEDARRGEQVYQKAQCGKCHRRGLTGEAMGPDLTSVPHRYQRGEMLEALLFPSQSIADDYGAVRVETKSGQVYVGVVQAAAGQVIVLQSTGDKVVLEKRQVDRVTPQRGSAMPDGLLDRLDEQEVLDLFAYLFLREDR